jgi:hypothetical protein
VLLHQRSTQREQRRRVDPEEEVNAPSVTGAAQTARSPRSPPGDLAHLGHPADLALAVTPRREGRQRRAAGRSSSEMRFVSLDLPPASFEAAGIHVADAPAGRSRRRENEVERDRWAALPGIEPGEERPHAAVGEVLVRLVVDVEDPAGAAGSFTRGALLS